MSIIANTFLRNSSPYTFRLLESFRPVHVTQVQFLFSSASLGIDGYVQNRKRVKEQFINFSDKFRTKMTDFVADPQNMIFTEDLKNMVHMAEPSDLSLLLEMVKKFNVQKSEFRFGSFVFGPVVMRMFHFLDAPKEALQCFEDPKNDGFFHQLVTFHILLDLLFVHEMYEDMYRVFGKIQELQLNMTKYPKYSVVLILAACYKQNTIESKEYAIKLFNEMSQLGSMPIRRACAFFAALMLNQGAPDLALECLSMHPQHYVTLRNMKVIALSQLGRVDDALPVLRSVLDVDSPEQTDKHTFFQETIDKVRSAIEKNTNNKDHVQEFENIVSALKDRKLIDDQTLDQMLNAEINLAPKKKDLPRGIPNRKRVPYGLRQNTTNF